MRPTWTRDFLMRRIDRCYLIAAWTKDAAKRGTYLRLARNYRALLSCRARPASSLAWITA